MNSIIDFLTYRSWYYQVAWYGMSFERARKFYKDALVYEEIYKNEEK